MDDDDVIDIIARLQERIRELTGELARVQADLTQTREDLATTRTLLAAYQAAQEARSRQDAPPPPVELVHALRSEGVRNQPVRLLIDDVEVTAVVDGGRGRPDPLREAQTWARLRDIVLRHELGHE